VGRAVRQRRRPIRGPADRDRPDPGPSHRRIDGGRTGRRGREPTCHCDQPVWGAAASSAAQSPAPPPPSAPRRWSPTVSAGAMIAERTAETTVKTDARTGATAAEHGRRVRLNRNEAAPEYYSRTELYLGRRIGLILRPASAILLAVVDDLDVCGGHGGGSMAGSRRGSRAPSRRERVLAYVRGRHHPDFQGRNACS
jgi:hypothetical protein